MLIRLYVFGFLKRFVIFQPIILVFYQSQGLSYTQIQSLGAVYFLSILIFEIPTGIMADLYSYRLSLVLSSLCILSSNALLSFGNSFYMYLVAQVANGMGYAFFSGCFSALFYETVISKYGKAAYTRKYFVYYAAQNIGSVCAYILCSVIVTYYGMVQTLFLTLAFSVITFTMSFVLPDNKMSPGHCQGDGTKNISRFFSLICGLRKDKSLFTLAVNGLAIGVVVHLALKFLPFHMKASSVSISFLGYIETATLLVSLVTLKYVFRPIERKKIRVFISVLVQLFMFLSFLVFGLVFRPVFSVMNVIFFETLYEIFHSMYEIEYNERVDAAIRASFLSTLSFFMSLFYALLSPATGILADSYGLPVVFFTFSVLILSVAGFFSAQRVKTLLISNRGIFRDHYPEGGRCGRG